jgi:hypothetical protein
LLTGSHEPIDKAMRLVTKVTYPIRAWKRGGVQQYSTLSGPFHPMLSSKKARNRE